MQTLAYYKSIFLILIDSINSYFSPLTAASDQALSFTLLAFHVFKLSSADSILQTTMNNTATQKSTSVVAGWLWSTFRPDKRNFPGKSRKSLFHTILKLRKKKAGNFLIVADPGYKRDCQSGDVAR